MIALYGCNTSPQTICFIKSLSSEGVRFTPSNPRQSVTAAENGDGAGAGAFWTIGGDGLKAANYDRAVLCGDTVTLFNAGVRQRLRVERTPSMLAKNGMASVMSEDESVDPSERFAVVCVNQKSGTAVKGGTVFHLQNIAISAHLFASKAYVFNAANCGRGCPLMNQLEVSSTPGASEATKWRVHSGLLYKHEGRPADVEKWVFERGEAFPGAKAFPGGDEL